MGDKPQSEKFRAFRLTMRFVVCALCLMLSAHPAATQVVAQASPFDCSRPAAAETEAQPLGRCRSIREKYPSDRAQIPLVQAWQPVTVQY